MEQKKCEFQKQVVTDAKLPYLLALPKDYGKDPGKRWPLMLFLHGAGERGDDLETIKRHGIPKLAEAADDLPYIALSPQCPEGSFWVARLHEVYALLQEIMASYAVDDKRVYLTGISMGGYGSWYLAMAHPETFAALVPICGGGMRWNAAALRDMPIWVFHGEEDPTVPLFESADMVKALRECGSDVRFTVYPGVAHDSWTQTYENPELFDWMLCQRKQ